MNVLDEFQRNFRKNLWKTSDNVKSNKREGFQSLSGKCIFRKTILGRRGVILTPNFSRVKTEFNATV